MAQLANINVALDEDIKDSMEKICADLGISVNTAFSIFATKIVEEKKIPFEIKAEPFYTQKNMSHLETVVANIEMGKAKFVEKTLAELEALENE